MKAKLLRKIKRDWDYFYVVDENTHPYKECWYFFNKHSGELSIYKTYEVHPTICLQYIGYSTYMDWHKERTEKLNKKKYQEFKNSTNNNLVIIKK